LQISKLPQYAAYVENFFYIHIGQIYAPFKR
jgi:hypothetical protein